MANEEEISEKIKSEYLSKEMAFDLLEKKIVETSKSLAEKKVELEKMRSQGVRKINGRQFKLLDREITKLSGFLRVLMIEKDRLIANKDSSFLNKKLEDLDYKYAESEAKKNRAAKVAEGLLASGQMKPKGFDKQKKIMDEEEKRQKKIRKQEEEVLSEIYKGLFKKAQKIAYREAKCTGYNQMRSSLRTEMERAEGIVQKIFKAIPMAKMAHYKLWEWRHGRRMFHFIKKEQGLVSEDERELRRQLDRIVVLSGRNPLVALNVFVERKLSNENAIAEFQIKKKKKWLNNLTPEELDELEQSIEQVVAKSDGQGILLYYPFLKKYQSIMNKINIAREESTIIDSHMSFFERLGNKLEPFYQKAKAKLKNSIEKFLDSINGDSNASEIDDDSIKKQIEQYVGQLSNDIPEMDIKELDKLLFYLEEIFNQLSTAENFNLKEIEFLKENIVGLIEDRKEFLLQQEGVENPENSYEILNPEVTSRPFLEEGIPTFAPAVEAQAFSNPLVGKEQDTEDFFENFYPQNEEPKRNETVGPNIDIIQLSLNGKNLQELEEQLVWVNLGINEANRDGQDLSYWIKLKEMTENQLAKLESLREEQEVLQEQDSETGKKKIDKSENNWAGGLFETEEALKAFQRGVMDLKKNLTPEERKRITSARKKIQAEIAELEEAAKQR